MASPSDAAIVNLKVAFCKLAPLFARDEYRGIYEVCLLHHFSLFPGEKGGFARFILGSFSLPNSIAFV